jgi:hypothetical protein
MSELSPAKVKRKQIMIAVGLISMAVLSTTAWVLIDSQGKKEEFDLNKSQKKIQIAKLAGGISAENKWLQHAEEEIKAIGHEVKSQKEDSEGLEEKVKALEGIIEVYERQKTERSDEPNVTEELLKLREEIDGLRSSQVRIIDGQIKPKGIKTIEINLDGNSSALPSGPKYKLDYYLPAGSYAKANLISGIDASVGVSSQSDPRPVFE